jgi:hypothetical protein
MTAEAAFRGSTYLTLAAATLCLASAEEVFFPGIIYLTIPVGLLMVLAYALEGRWAFSNRWFNLVGVLIVVASAGWLASQLRGPPPPWLESATWPAAFLPLAGPILVMLLVAKLFRPKGTWDYWGLHALGLMEVALACVLALEPWFAGLLVAYVACGVWSLTLFAQHRQKHLANAGTMIGAPSSSAREPVGFWLAMRRTGVIVALGLGLFLLTPRLSNPQWQFTNPARAGAQTGFASNIDLNHVGPIHVSKKVIFEAYVEDTEGKPVVDLDPEQRWRGTTLDYYHQGRWLSRKMDRPGRGLAGFAIRHGSRETLPVLGDDQCLVTYRLDPGQAGGLFLLDPVSLPADRRKSVVVATEPGEWYPFFLFRDLTLNRPRGGAPAHYTYQQVARKAVGTGRTEALRVDVEYKHGLLEQPLALVRAWTFNLLDRLVGEGHQTSADLALRPDPELRAGFPQPPQHRARVARALSNYLANSGEFTYTLEMRRRDRELDAVEDFLINAKRGHCEHYATALTLMLRSVGIPARVVSGFRGAESRAAEGEPGWYSIREDQAHTWVEALMEEPDGQGKMERFWLTLDATPGREAAAARDLFSLALWWQNARNFGDTLWRDMIIDSNVDPVREAAATLWHSAFGNRGEDVGSARAALPPRVYALAILAAVVAVGLGIWLLVRLGRLLARIAARRRSVALEGPELILYHRWLRAVARRLGLRPLPAETPHEFAEKVTEALKAEPSMIRLAELPAQMVGALYQVRFGGRPLGAAARKEMETLLGAFAASRPSP